MCVWQGLYRARLRQQLHVILRRIRCVLCARLHGQSTGGQCRRRGRIRSVPRTCRIRSVSRTWQNQVSVKDVAESGQCRIRGRIRSLSRIWQNPVSVEDSQNQVSVEDSQNQVTVKDAAESGHCRGRSRIRSMSRTLRNQVLQQHCCR